MKAYIVDRSRILKYGGAWGVPSRINSDPELYQSLWPKGLPVLGLEGGHFFHVPQLTQKEREVFSRLVFDLSQSKGNVFPDVLCNGRSLIAKQAFINLLSDLDTREIDIIPIRIFKKKQNEFVNEDTWLIHYINKVDCVVEERSRTKIDILIESDVEVRQLYYLVNDKQSIVIKEKSILGLDIWRDVNYPTNIFCSERFVKMFKKAKLKSISFNEVTVE